MSKVWIRHSILLKCILQSIHIKCCIMSHNDLILKIWPNLFPDFLESRTILCHFRCDPMN